MNKSPKEYIIDIVLPDSPLIYAISKRGLFRTHIELYDIKDSRGKATMINKLLRANPEFQGRMKALQFLENNTHNELLLGTVSIPNRLVDNFTDALKHEFNYLEITQPNSVLVQAIHERQENQKILSKLFSGERFPKAADIAE